MKVVIISVVLAVVTGAAGVFGLSMNGESSGDQWYGIFGLPFMFAVMVTGSPVLAGVIHLALCTCVVYLIASMIRRRRQAA